MLTSIKSYICTALLLISLPAFGQNLELDDPLPLDLTGKDVIKWSASSGLREANGDAVVVFGLKTLRGFSIYESKLTITPPIDHTIKSQEFPSSSTAIEPETGKELKVYKEGQFVVTLTPTSAEAVKKDKVVLSLRYIACTDKICLFPTKEKIEIELSSLTPLNPNVLEQFNDNQATPELDATKKKITDTTTSIETPTNKKPNLLISLFYAFLGGLILNLMPCVFPMLGIKVMSVVKKSGATTRTIRLSGILYTLGVVISFVVFALVIAIFKSYGTSVGWGFQLQSPAFIAGLATLFVLMGLNFFGFFEFGIPAEFVPQSFVKHRDGLFGEFMAGVMVAVVASPCTAPFMASALGYALSMPAPIMILIFTFLGLGLGAPFLVLTFYPALTKYLPRPGNWMITFRQILAFPLFLTSVWLVWVYNQQTNPDQVFALLCLMIAITFMLWLYKTTKSNSRIFRIIALALSLIPVAMSGIPTFQKKAKALKASQNSSGLYQKHGVEWHIFTPTKAQELADAGKTVFVDFTAAWCITCQANAKTIFGSKRVVDYIKNNSNVALVYADWTDGDESMTKVLEQYKAPGVPLYLVYKPGESEPKKLPQILTPDIFLNALK